MTAKLDIIGESGKFVHDIIWIGLSHIFTSLLNIITLPALTKTYTTESYGIWSQVNVTVSFIVPVVCLQFVTAVVRFLAAEENSANRRRSLGTMLSAILIFSCLMFLVTNLVTVPLSNFLFGGPAYGNFVRLTFLWTFVDALFIFFIAYWRARRKMKKLSIVQAVFSASKIVLIIILASLGMALEWIILCMVGVELVYTLYIFVDIVREDGFPVLNFSGLKGFLAFSAPQIPTGILIWLISASDRYFITHILNLSQTGIYATSVALSGAIALFYMPVGYVLLPAVSKAWEQQRQSNVKQLFEYSSKIFLTCAIPATVGLAMLSQPLLKLLTTSEYLAGLELILILSVSQIFLGLFNINEYIIYLVKQTKWEPVIMLVATTVSIGLNILLIPQLGLNGAGLSKIVAYFVLAVVVTVWTKKAINYNIEYKYMGKVIIASLVMAFCLYFIRINGIGGIILSFVAGILVFVTAFYLLKPFSQEERGLIKQTVFWIAPWFHREKY